MGSHTLALTAADYTPRLSGSATSETLGGVQRELSARQRGLQSPLPPRCLEDERNEPRGMAREARKTRGTKRQPSGRTEFLSRANPLPQLPCLASSLALTSLPSAFLGGQPRAPSPEPAWTSQRSRPRRSARSPGSPAATHPARHLRGHVRLPGCSSALC